ncbi:MAG: NAD-dependent epimerase/dehydratase family protein [Nostoc sp. CmiVER01]|uniref:NAD-dependent epimerase/dehydratase family protein n=1 Tax=Nostoc sp. CmiVER01 TaxID=3075384 RepID=UPI002AD570F1|nr:NAD-dependent epimerase/dehydratase family protein [Nostoc sp. CmiVER01]MDZ8126968.1 NAD-dependent epimerase/dehydratase family protein [Nostoc sp. CmiVER01]
MHFVITGGAGFIGSHLVEELLLEGHSITVVDNLTTGSQLNLPKHPRLELLEKDILTCQPKDFVSRIDGIAHLAATSSVRESWLRPLETHHNNLSTTIAVIQLCEALNIPRFVFTSSAAVYGNVSKPLITEELDSYPTSPYGLHKLVSEQYGNLFTKKLNFSFVALRLFNVFGPRQKPDSHYAGVISLFATAMQQNLPITIYGDGSQTRDFVYVRDAAIALTNALTIPLSPGTSLTCNVGTGKSTSIIKLMDILKTYFPQWKAKINYASPRLGEIQDSQADISRATSTLGFRPQWSIESGCHLLIESMHKERMT